MFITYDQFMTGGDVGGVSGKKAAKPLIRVKAVFQCETTESF